MNLTRLSWKNLINKPLSSFLSLLLMTLGVGLISFILVTTSQLQSRFERNIKGIDMVVGAKGSPLQLILSAVFQIDNPTGNIPLEEATKIKRNRYVGKVIPLSYGDSYQGYRIVGTDTSYLGLYDAKLSEGKLWKEEMEVVIGADIATILNLNPGDTFESAHGLSSEGEMHDEHPFKVSGILEKNNSVLDKLILTATESIWHVHEYEENENLQREVTALLVKFSSPMGMVRIPRLINQNTNYQAAIPAFEVNRLLSLMGSGIETLYILASVIILVSGLSVFISLYSAMKERRYELALMRTYGASRWQLAVSLIQESLILSLGGFILGILFSRVGTLVLNSYLNKTSLTDISWFFLDTTEIYLLPGVLVIGFLAAVIPTIQVFKINISGVLSEG